MTPILQHTFYQLAGAYCSNSGMMEQCLAEIEKQYSGKKRHYHTLTHLENLLTELTAVKAEIRDWDTILFTLFYHDVVYQASKNNNEEKSADLAAARMTALTVPAECIARCKQQILATKSHQTDADYDTNLFTDADLSILGKDAGTYTAYFKNVRKEYSIYPDLLYKPGRKKVLEHFLNMSRIFKTDFFFNRYEKQARENLKMELNLL
ncbi:MAG: hypothetical protein HYZ14_03540 [Bacteroidetes bacterium]|nr:hypothetical protein [Bacteroidota bacterium]